MKKLITVLIVGASAWTVKAVASEDFRPALIKEMPTHVFTPASFDNNDNAQVVLAGEYSSTCYKVGPVEALVDEQAKRIVVRNGAYFYSGCWCAQVEVPYVQTVDLGILRAGQYDVALESQSGKLVKMGALHIALSANQGPDDYLYAPVDQVRVSISQEEAPVLELRGQFNTSCMELADVKVFYRAGNVIEVLPTATYKDTGDCVKGARAFARRVRLDGANRGKSLVHVRSLNGRAFNTVFDF